MVYINRKLDQTLKSHVTKGDSILLLGPRQTGKTTLLSHVKPDQHMTLMMNQVRQRYEKNIGLFRAEITQIKETLGKSPLVIVDEIQKVPELLDDIQVMIDEKQAQFILTGSSARKLRKRSHDINLLPGRLTMLRLDPLTQEEFPVKDLNLNLLYGNLPAVSLEANAAAKEVYLESYVQTYLEEEVRAEALSRNIGAFARFLEHAALDSGKIVSFRNISNEIGVSHVTVSAYYEILEDCLIAERIDPLTTSSSRKKLTKASRYLFFDMGVRRLAADEGIKLNRERLGDLFEHFIGLELVRLSRLQTQKFRLRFWRDPGGPEVDWVIDRQHDYIPIEVKWSETPGKQDARHLNTFLDEYKDRCQKAYVICRTPRAYKIDQRITALPWQDLPSLVRF